MEQLRTLEEIKAEVNKMVTDREEKIRLLIEQHDQAIQNATAANEKAHEAYAEMDVKAYHKALDEARSNKDAADMFMTKKAEIENTPYIDKEKYDSLVKEVYAYLDHYVQESTEALTDPVRILYQIAKSTSSMLSDGNRFLEYLQLKVYKDDGVRIIDGRPLYMRSSRKDYKNFSLVSTLNRIIDEPTIKELLKDKETD